MQNIKKYFMTLALLLTAVTGAWAQDPTVNFPSEITVGEEFSFSFDSPDNVETVYLEIGNVFEIFSGISSNVGTLKYTYNGNLRGETAVSLYFLINGFQLQVVKGVTIKEPAPAEITEWPLTPDADKKVWTLAKMPGGNVELQVEYYPESNLFLGKEALKDKANISVLNGETAVAFDDDGKSTATVTEGNTVTAKFTGKKVLGMKVEKKAKSLIVNPIVGQVIGSDGKNYAYGSLPTGVTAVAKICYVSGSNGLALALTDEESYMNWSTAQTTCAAHTPAITGGTWKLATKDEWDNMINAAGGYTALRNGFSSVDGTNMKEDYPYWSSTEDGSNAALRYFFAYGVCNKGDKGSVGYVRACLAF